MPEEDVVVQLLNQNPFDIIEQKRRVLKTVELRPANYRRTAGDSEMMTREDRSTLVQAAIILAPDDPQKPKKFIISIGAVNREDMGDNTTYEGEGTDTVEITIASNEYFVRFENEIKEYRYSNHVGGQRWGWYPLPARNFVKSIAVSFDGRGREDQTHQALKANLEINYIVAVVVSRSKGTLPDSDIEGLGVNIGEEPDYKS